MERVALDQRPRAADRAAAPSSPARRPIAAVSARTRVAPPRDHPLRSATSAAAASATASAPSANGRSRTSSGGSGGGATTAATGAGTGTAVSPPNVSPRTTVASASQAAGQAFAVEGGTTVESTMPRAVGASTHEVGVTRMPAWRVPPFRQTTVIRDASVRTVSSVHPSSGFASFSASKSFCALAPLITSRQSPASAGREVTPTAAISESDARASARRGGEGDIRRQHRSARSQATTGTAGHQMRCPMPYTAPP